MDKLGKRKMVSYFFNFQQPKTWTMVITVWEPASSSFLSQTNSRSVRRRRRFATDTHNRVPIYCEQRYNISEIVSIYYTKQSVDVVLIVYSFSQILLWWPV